MRRNLLKLVRTECELYNNFCSMLTKVCNITQVSKAGKSYCNDYRDLDLCHNMDQEWCCVVPQCGQPYAREMMENALIQIIRQRERLYHLQDLVCLKCNQIKAAHLAEHCPCVGSFACKEDSSEFCSKMQPFLNVAVNQKFSAYSRKRLLDFTSSVAVPKFDYMI
ncbi:hypothetical protein OROHE_019048 [Orobanche hederae]